MILSKHSTLVTKRTYQTVKGKVIKLNKVKINEIQDKSYILELENQVKMLTSTIELKTKGKHLFTKGDPFEP